MTLAADADVWVDDCYRCGYDLRGVADDQPCPECGLLAVRSRRPSDELHATRPGWLRRLAWGVKLILLAVLLLALSPIAIEAIRDEATTFTWAGRSSSSWWYALWQHAPIIWADVAALALLAGVLLLTSREGYEPADRADARRRRLLRVAALPPLLAAVVGHFAVQLNVNAVLSAGPWEPADTDWVDMTAFLLLTIGLVPLPILLMYQLRSLAKRARHPQLAEDCAIVGVGNAVTLLYAPVFVLISSNAVHLGLGTNWTSRSTAALLLMLTLAVLSIGFALWNVYLLVRFWLAFRRASRMLRTEWRRDDRAAGPAAASG